MDGFKHHLVAKHIGDALKTSVVALGLVSKGFPPDAISSHSLRAGGAIMAMHLNGISPVAIRKQGHWSSDTFLTYIHEQVSAFSAGLSTSMAPTLAGATLLAQHSSMINEDLPAHAAST